MKRTTTHIALLLTLSLLTEFGVMAQRVSFGLNATSGIVLQTGSVDELDFNAKQTVIMAGQTVSISFTDAQTAILSISACVDYDVTVTIDAPQNLDLINTIHKAPLKVGFAYSNLGAVNEEIAKTQAVLVPEGFNSATFPVLRRAAAQPPGPPPTPDHVDYTQLRATAYIFIYGTLGPVPTNAASGIYSGDIQVTVTYSTY